MSLFQTLFKRQKKIPLSIEIIEMDVINRNLREYPSTLFSSTLSSSKGPITAPIVIVPKMNKPKWYQFWLKKKYRDEVNKEIERKTMYVFRYPK